MTTAEPTPKDAPAVPAVGIPLDRTVRPGAEARPLVERLRERAGQYDECDWHGEIEREAADEIERLNFQRQILQSESDRLRSRNARLRVEITRELIAQGWTAPKA